LAIINDENLTHIFTLLLFLIFTAFLIKLNGGHFIAGSYFFRKNRPYETRFDLLEKEMGNAMVKFIFLVVPYLMVVTCFLFTDLRIKVMGFIILVIQVKTNTSVS